MVCRVLSEQGPDRDDALAYWGLVLRVLLRLEHQLNLVLPIAWRVTQCKMRNSVPDSLRQVSQRKPSTCRSPALKC